MNYLFNYNNHFMIQYPRFLIAKHINLLLIILSEEKPEIISVVFF